MVLPYFVGSPYFPELFDCLVKRGNLFVVAGGKENFISYRYFTCVHTPYCWGILVVPKWWSPVPIDHVSSQGNTPFLARDVHHCSQWYAFFSMKLDIVCSVTFYFPSLHLSFSVCGVAPEYQAMLPSGQRTLLLLIHMEFKKSKRIGKFIFKQRID